MRPIENLPLSGNTCMSADEDGKVILHQGRASVRLTMHEIREMVAQLAHAARHGCDDCEAGVCVGDNLICSDCEVARMTDDEIIAELGLEAS